MLVQFTPEQESQLFDLAARHGVDPTLLVRDTALQLLAEDQDLQAAVREGIAQADRGELLDSDEVDILFEKMLRG